MSRMFLKDSWSQVPSLTLMTLTSLKKLFKVSKCELVLLETFNNYVFLKVKKIYPCFSVFSLHILQIVYAFILIDEFNSVLNSVLIPLFQTLHLNLLHLVCIQ